MTKPRLMWRFSLTGRLSAVALCWLWLVAVPAMGQSVSASVFQSLRHDELALESLVDVYESAAEDLGLAVGDFAQWQTLVLVAEHHSERAGLTGKGLLLWSLTELTRPEEMIEFRKGLTEVRRSLTDGRRVDLNHLLAVGRGLSSMRRTSRDVTFRALATNSPDLLDASWRRGLAASAGLNEGVIDRVCGAWNDLDAATLEESLHQFLVNRVVFQLMRDGFPTEPIFLYMSGDGEAADASITSLIAAGAAERSIIVSGHSDQEESSPGLSAIIESRIEQLLRDAVGEMNATSLAEMPVRDRLRALAVTAMSVGTDVAFDREVGVDRVELTRFAQETSLVEFDSRWVLLSTGVGDAVEAAPTVEELRNRAHLLRQELAQHAHEARESMQGNR